MRHVLSHVTSRQFRDVPLAVATGVPAGVMRRAARASHNYARRQRHSATASRHEQRIDCHCPCSGDSFDDSTPIESELRSAHSVKHTMDHDLP